MQPADDWIYAGEGGAHVIFSFQPRLRRDANTTRADDAASPRPPPFGLTEGSLLRVAKQDIVRCTCIITDDNGSEEDGTRRGEVDGDETALWIANCADADENVAEDELWYMAKVVAPSLQHYVDLPKVALLNCRLAGDLCRRAMKSGKIPSHRQSSWQVVNETQSSALPAHVRGLLLRDYRIPRLGLNHHQQQQQHSAVLSVEIKPKAGYTAISPLVEPDRRDKYHRCRFRLLHDQEATRYNPLDLYSLQDDDDDDDDASRMRQAIEALIDEPRNNFRTWLRQGPRHDITPQGNPAALMPRWMAGSSTGTLVQLLVQVLRHEGDFLKRILALQRLDVIDSDGAVRIYDCLVHRFLHGSHERAWALLDVKGNHPNSSKTESADSSHNILKSCDRLSSCPPALLGGLTSTPSPVLHKYLQMVDKLETLLLLGSGDPNHDDDDDDDASTTIDTLHQDSVSLVESSMSQDDCLVLLRLWLLSLAMCDVSFFVSFQIVRVMHENPKQKQPSSQQQETVRFQRRQTVESSGLLVYRHIDGTMYDIGYEIKVIDCDRKPAQKLKSRRKKEDANFASLSVS